ncbi:hypothetical protein OT109_18645 [Phycisphaeraceae bacterium D3-23]
MRGFLATLIWLADLVLKLAIGYFVVFLVWLPFTLFADISYGIGWIIAGGILGACINGFLEDCDLILLGWAKRVSGDT